MEAAEPRSRRVSKCVIEEDLEPLEHLAREHVLESTHLCTGGAFVHREDVDEERLETAIAAVHRLGGDDSLTRNLDRAVALMYDQSGVREAANRSGDTRHADAGGVRDIADPNRPAGARQAMDVLEVVFLTGGEFVRHREILDVKTGRGREFS